MTISRRDFARAGLVLTSTLAMPSHVRAQASKTITMGTAGPGSVVYVWVTSLASALESISAPVRIQVNAGVFDTEALRVLDTGGAGLDSSFVGGSSLATGSLGRPPFAGKPTRNVRGAFPLGQAPVMVVSRAEANVGGIKDLNGKRVTAGPAGIGNDVMMREFIKKVAPDVKVQFVPMPYSAFAGALQDGKIDVEFVFGWPPYPAIVEAASLCKLRYVQFTDQEMKTWMADNPQHHRMVLKAGMNPQQDKDIVTFGHVSHLIVPAKLDAQVLYELTKAWLRKDVRAKLLEATSSWEAAFMALESGLFFEDLVALKVKLHPGAARAYKEAGIAVPSAILE